MFSEKQISSQFTAELRELLKKYKATIIASDHWQGYSECGRDIRMVVEIPSIYDKEVGEYTHEYTEIDFGSTISFE